MDLGKFNPCKLPMLYTSRYACVLLFFSLY